MATNGREVRLKVAVDTEGEDGLKQLAADVRGLGTAAGASTPELDRLGAELDALAAATEARRKAEASARSEAAASRAALDSQRDALALLRIESDRATKQTADYQTAERALRVAVVEARTALRDKQAAVTAAATDARIAAAAEQQLAAEIKSVATAAAASARVQVESNTAVGASAEVLQGQLSALRNLAGLALGGSIVGGLARDLAETADAAAGLSARIKLVTGDGAAFTTAFQGVVDIAQRTGTAVEDVGALFNKLAQAGKQLNLSNADALRLTETITQATALGGASAESSTAAIVQFTQAIASGVLRGDELNSILEQSPRLALALAAGLGVTTGELRKLGEAGSLTAQQVIASLQGQSATLQREFEQLPPTVGRAITTLSNAWTIYVGQVDKATGASTTAASAIVALSKNLDTVGTVLFELGKGIAAYQALKLAATFLEGAAAIRAAAAATAVATAATTANTAAVAANTVAQRANVAATATTGAATAATVGARAAEIGGALAGIVGFASKALGVTAAIAGVVAIISLLIDAFKFAGKFIGEGIAKLQGFSETSVEAARTSEADAEATRRNAAEKAALSQQLQIATEKALGLTDQSRALVAEFEKTLKGGADTATALNKLSKSLELGSLSGITAAGTALDVLGQRAELTGSQIRDALAGALKDVDLSTFRINALAAFDQSEQGARRLQAALDAIGGESLRRAGTSLEELKTGFSTASTSAINDLDALSATLKTLALTGDDAGRALAASLDKAIATAATERAVQAVIDRVKALGEQGLLTGDQLAAGLDKARQKIDSLKPGVDSLNEALKNFGLQTREELQATADKLSASYQRIATSTSVSLADQRKAFDAYAAAAIAANKGVEPTAVAVARAMLEIKEAAAGAGQSIETGMQQGGRAVDDLTGKVNKLGERLNQAAGSLSSVSKAAESSSTLGTNTYDAQNFATDSTGARIVSNTQANVPAGYSFDQQSFQRDSNFAAAHGQKPPDPNNPRYLINTTPAYTVPPYNPNSGGVSNGSAGVSPFGNAGSPAPAPAPAPQKTFYAPYTINGVQHNAAANTQAAADAAAAAAVAAAGSASKPGTPTPVAPPPAAANTVVNVTIGANQYSIGTTSKSAADQLVEALEVAFRAGGG